MNNCTSFQRKYSFVIIIPGFTSYTEEMATSLYFFWIKKINLSSCDFKHTFTVYSNTTNLKVRGLDNVLD